jgi:hypothetical protein
LPAVWIGRAPPTNLEEGEEEFMFKEEFRVQGEAPTNFEEDFVCECVRLESYVNFLLSE